MQGLFSGFLCYKRDIFAFDDLLWLKGINELGKEIFSVIE